MTPQIAVAVIAFFGLVAAPAFASDQSSCSTRQNAISGQIEQARAAGNTYQIAGLEKALKKAKANCTEAGLKKQQAERTAKAHKEVSQRKADLTAALQSGNAQKINKRQEKLAQSQQALEAQLNKTRID